MQSLLIKTTICVSCYRTRIKAIVIFLLEKLSRISFNIHPLEPAFADDSTDSNTEVVLSLERLSSVEDKL